MDLGIGEFARLGGVSVRTLHHYDAVGLLRPAHVDARSGRRRYAAAQLRDLSRVVTLKELGFTLAEAAELLARGPGDDALREALLTRRAELEQRHAETAHRLAQLDARLRLLDDGPTGREDVVVRDVAPVRVAALTEVLPTGEGHGARVEALFTRASDLMDAGHAARTTPIGRFVPVTDGSVHVLAGFELAGDAPHGMTVEVVPAARVAAVLHHGPMAGIGTAAARLDAWAREHAPSSGEVRRWLFLEADGLDQGDWVVEVQLELAVR